MPSADAIVATMEVSRSRAYEIKGEIATALSTLARPPGRPRVEPDPERAPASGMPR